jgi:D-glycero-alpha-D-manno-heptose-7-phosphate kinase
VIISRTPFRVSFFGGGTDYPDWYRQHGGAVLATTIDKYCYISLRELPPFFEHRFRLVYSVVENVKEVCEISHPSARACLEWLRVDTGLEIHHDGDLPARSGLGSSSAFTVGLLHAMRAFEGRQVSKGDLASQALHVEQCVLREAVGSQDQISAAFGGFNRITFHGDGKYQVDPMILPRPRVAALQDHLMLFFTGISRTAAEVAHATIKNLKHRTAEMHTIRQMVDEAIEILSSPSTDLAEFGRLLHKSWMLKRRLSDCVSNQTVDGIYAAAVSAGAIGGKLLGAGGGGFMLLFVRPEHRSRVAASLRHLVNVPIHFESAGSRIVLYQPDGWQRQPENSYDSVPLPG